jgi:hypothetical protein
MNIYHYDGITKVYLQTTAGRLDPLDHSRLLIPAKATDQAPPSVSVNQIQRYEDSGWQIIPDFRGETIHNPTTKDEKVVTDVGNISEGYALGNLSPEPITLEQKLSELANHRFQVETSNITIAGIQIKTDRESQSMINSAFTALSSGMIESTDWKGVDGWTSVTLEQLTPLATAVALHVADCFRKERVASGIIKELSEGEIQVIDIPTLWNSVE